MKPNVNSVEVHPQLSNNRHPVDGVLMGAGSLWSYIYEGVVIEIFKWTVNDTFGCILYLLVFMISNGHYWFAYCTY
jgi:hypothetical protein